MLETDRLVLREWHEADWPAFFAGTNTPAVMRWLGGVMEEDREAAQRARIENCFAAYGHGFLAVERKADRELLGFCGVKLSDKPGGPIGDHEIGWRMREDSWGQGYAREAALAVRDHAFRELAAPHLIALTVMANRPSWGLMERIGMRRDTALDFASDDWNDGLIVGWRLDRADWERFA